MGTPALIALGSNLGDRAATLDRAIADLGNASGVSVRAVSSYHATAPVGGPGGQGAFLNAAAALETTLEPAELHRLLFDVERRAGRVREVRWDARTLDLDLILFGDRIIDTPDLTVPHPRFAVRRFVLAPLAEVAPDATDPMTGRTALDLLVNLDRRPSYVAIDGPNAPGLTARVAGRVARELGAEDRCRGPAAAGSGGKGDLSRRLDEFEANVRGLSEAIDYSRTQPADCWIVTNSCPGLDLLRLGADAAKSLASLTELARIEAIERCSRKCAEMGASVRSPTFCVAIGFQQWGWGLEFMGRAVDFPLLIPEATDEDGIVAEVLSACEATRP